MQTLYLIRHTTPNIAHGICYGQLDIGVADSFKKEADHVLLWLPPLDLIVASPLLRTRRLAEYLVKNQCCELRYDARLMEKHFGTWEGKPWSSIARDEIDAWAADITGYAPPDGESAQKLMQRVQHCLSVVLQLPQKSIALVGHGGSIRAILALLGGKLLNETLSWEIDYGGVICIRPVHQESMLAKKISNSETAN